MPEKTAPTKGTHLYRPGLHSHSVARLTRERLAPEIPFRRSKLVLTLVGIICLGSYGYSLGDQYVYQAYENWAFDQQIAGHSDAAFTDYIRERTPFGFLFGSRALKTASIASAPNLTSIENRPLEGDLIGRVSVGRLNLAAIIREGVSDKTLSVAVGHVPATALPGQPGNFALAAHRDTLFRGLKDIRIHDLVTVQSAAGSFTYQVLATKIVRPSDVSVLRSDGGGFIPSDSQAPEKLLTLITCYPFRYVGSAPNRFIVEARLVSEEPQASSQIEGLASKKTSTVPKVPHTAAATSTHVGTRHKRLASTPRVKRTASVGSASIRKPVRKRNWWQRIFDSQ